MEEVIRCNIAASGWKADSIQFVCKLFLRSGYKDKGHDWEHEMGFCLTMMTIINFIDLDSWWENQISNEEKPWGDLIFGIFIDPSFYWLLNMTYKLTILVYWINDATDVKTHFN